MAWAAGGMCHTGTTGVGQETLAYGIRCACKFVEGRIGQRVTVAFPCSSYKITLGSLCLCFI